MKFKTTIAKLADIALVTGAVGCLLALCNFVYLYSWTGRRQFTTAVGPFFYYGAPALAAILLFATFKLSTRQRLNVALCVCSGAVSVYGLEFLLTLWTNTPQVREMEILNASIEAARAQGVQFDARTKAQVIDDLQARGINAVPSIFPKALLRKLADGSIMSPIVNDGVELLPFGGISHKPTVVCNESGHYLVYSTDAHGFNNPDSIWKDLKADVVAVGDSFTQGWCATPENNFIDQVRKKHPTILNLGIEGNGPLMELATLREYGEIFKPKVVLWFYFEGNDLADLIDERKNPLLNEYLETGFSQHLMSRQAEIDSVLTDDIQRFKSGNRLLAGIEDEWSLATHLPRGIPGIIRLTELRQRLGLVGGRLANSPSKVSDTDGPASPNPLVDLFSKVLSNARTSVNAWGGELYFVYLPQRERYLPRGNAYLNPFRDQVLKVVSANGLRLIDMDEDFKAQQDPLAMFPFRIGVHYNDAGHSLVAEKVRRSISEGTNLCGGILVENEVCRR